MPRFSLKTLLVVLTAIATACGVLVLLSPLLPYSPVILLIAYVFFLLFGAPSTTTVILNDDGLTSGHAVGTSHWLFLIRLGW